MRELGSIDLIIGIASKNAWLRTKKGTPKWPTEINGQWNFYLVFDNNGGKKYGENYFQFVVLLISHIVEVHGT